MLSITLSEPTDLASVGTRWQALEARAEGSFFQSWAWVGCLAAERYPHPVLLEAREGDAVVALGLFNRRGAWFEPERLWLGESGNRALDSIFVEHNGLLVARGRSDLLATCLRAALTLPLRGRRPVFGRRLVLSGVDAAHLAAATAAPAPAPTSALALRRHAARAAPFIDLAALPAETSYLAGLSANTRYQIRRSDRRYAAMGALVLRRADTVAEAQDFLDRLAALHQASWTRRGHQGAFAGASFRQFHRALIARAMPAGTVDLLCVTAADRPVGYLYNFRLRGRVSAYQSGFDYAGAQLHQKPGLTCHHLAIEMYRREGASSYDFLAGADRYKLSLANAGTTLHWLELAPRWPRLDGLLRRR